MELQRIILILLSLVVSVKCELELFIVNGSVANIIDVPHSVFIFIDCEIDGKTRQAACGGSILNQVIILTAGHCLASCNKNTNITIFAGDVSKRKGFKSTAQSFVVHQDFQSGLANDIALIKLRIPLKFSRNIQRVILMRNPPKDKTALVAGWGLTSRMPNATTDILLYTKQKVLDKKECVKRLGTTFVNTICTEPLPGWDRPTFGDSGSALIVRGYMQIGIVSRGYPKINDIIGVYEEVKPSLHWIDENARRLMNDC